MWGSPILLNKELCFPDFRDSLKLWGWILQKVGALEFHLFLVCRIMHFIKEFRIIISILTPDQCLDGWMMTE